MLEHPLLCWPATPGSVEELPWDVLLHILLEKNLFFTASDSSIKSDAKDSVVSEALVKAGWTIEAESPDWRSRSDIRTGRPGGWQATVRAADKLAAVMLTHAPSGEWSWQLCANDRSRVDTLRKLMGELLPIAPIPEGLWPIIFWNQTSNGFCHRERRIVCPVWSDELERNYVGDGVGLVGACPTIKDLVNIARPDGRGSLVLLHGAPGTGKTYAIRALVRAWSSWCNAHYVIDPETLFRNPDYMTKVLLGNKDETEGDYDDNDPEDTRWRLVVMEDADEFLSVEAKMLVGQSLARLLNVTDGLMGQGMRLIVLITTNEELGKIHKAIGREGRCLAKLEFKPLDGKASNAWLKAKGSKDTVDSGRTLADLYAIASGERQIGGKK